MNLVAWLQEARHAGASLKRACEEIDLNMRTYKRWRKDGVVQADKRPTAVRPAPSNKLSEEEHQAILRVCNEPAFAQLPPTQIVPALLDEGRYLGSEASYYRVLRMHDQLFHRGRSQTPKVRVKPRSHTAAGPNEVWSWDVTYLASQIRGRFYYLYMFEDIYSRKIVGYEVHERECGELAAQLVQRCQLK